MGKSSVEVIERFEELRLTIQKLVTEKMFYDFEYYKSYRGPYYTIYYTIAKDH